MRRYVRLMCEATPLLPDIFCNDQQIAMLFPAQYPYTDFGRHRLYASQVALDELDLAL